MLAGFITSCIFAINPGVSHQGPLLAAAMVSRLSPESKPELRSLPSSDAPFPHGGASLSRRRGSNSNAAAGAGAGAVAGGAGGDSDETRARLLRVDSVAAAKRVGMRMLTKQKSRNELHFQESLNEVMKQAGGLSLEERDHDAKHEFSDRVLYLAEVGGR